MNTLGKLVLGIVILITLTIIVYLIGCICYSAPIFYPSLTEARQKYVPNENVAHGIHVTMTTMPVRLSQETFKQTIVSILMQDPRPQSVHMNIPWTLKRTGEQYTIPKWLKDLDDIVEIHRCEDMGPATKYLPTIPLVPPEDLLWVVDDDMTMPHGTIREVQRIAKEIPNKAFTSWGRRMQRNKVGEISCDYESCDSFYSEDTWRTSIGTMIRDGSKRAIKSNEEPVDVDFLLGVSGYGFRPHMVDLDELGDYENMPDEAFFVDDIVLSGHLSKRNIPRVVPYGIPFPWMRLVETIRFGFEYIFPGTGKEALSTSANHDINRNNNAVIHHFKQYW